MMALYSSILLMSWLVQASTETYKSSLNTTVEGVQRVGHEGSFPTNFTFKYGNDSVMLTIYAATMDGLAVDDLSAHAFGFMMKGKANRYVHVELEKGHPNASVSFYDGYGNHLQGQNEVLPMYEKIAPFEWIAAVTIPEKYFPEGIDKLAAYSNYSMSDNATWVILSLAHPNLPSKGIPNLHGKKFFVDFDSEHYFPHLNAGGQSKMWQLMLAAVAGDIPEETSKPDQNNSVVISCDYAWFLSCANILILCLFSLNFCN